MVARPIPVLRAASWDDDAVRLVGHPVLRVHSVFERALNLQAASGELLGLVGPGAGNGPATIVLATMPAAGFSAAGLAAGRPASAQPGWLDVDGRVTVDLRSALTWTPAPARSAPPAGLLLARLATAERLAQAAAPDDGLARLLPRLADLSAGAGNRPPPPAPLTPVGRAAWSALLTLLPAWQRRDAHAVHEAATRLIGLGPGLTPSGDDLLAGLLVATARIRGAPDAELGQACRDAAHGQTTDIALARIGHAARGRIEEVQQDVLVGLFDPHEAPPDTADAQFQAAVRRAARWGHSSGVDTLVGLFLGLRVELPRSAPGTLPSACSAL